MLDEAAGRAIDWLCAACWHDQYEKNIREAKEREPERKEASKVSIK